MARNALCAWRLKPFLSLPVGFLAGRERAPARGLILGRAFPPPPACPLFMRGGISALEVLCASSHRPIINSLFTVRTLDQRRLF